MRDKILLVEDESIVRMDISLILQDAGFEVIGEAGNGEEAIELVHQQQPDLIIMDIKMPKMNGLKASTIISRHFNIPILLLTAYSQQEYIEKAKEATIVGYLVKPISEDRLIPAVEIALHQGEVSRRYQKEIEDAENRLETRKLVEQAKGILMKRFGYSEEVSFKKIQDISMNKQVAMERVAKTVIKKYKDDSVSV